MATVIEGAPMKEQVELTEERKSRIRSMVTIYNPCRLFRTPTPAHVTWSSTSEKFTPSELEFFASCLVEAAQTMRELNVEAGFAPEESFPHK